MANVIKVTIFKDKLYAFCLIIGTAWKHSDVSLIEL